MKCSMFIERDIKGFWEGEEEKKKTECLWIARRNKMSEIS